MYRYMAGTCAGLTGCRRLSPAGDVTCFLMLPEPIFRERVKKGPENWIL
jgi:hypothetical protein